jgi:hypothetical protein
MKNFHFQSKLGEVQFEIFCSPEFFSKSAKSLLVLLRDFKKKFLDMVSIYPVFKFNIFQRFYT